ncbi:Harbinger transposase-derived nuclease domain [Arabidopsis suecica]|uniref:Harbinger transposase-derived nuclease domain n=1 Tax=Arabidopsis suecica TaxID=45249 RepID=A0A8T1YHN0_ARASU|nr:Harbinger transposase-derived nuclease domain [Arabidopsis suecica]
MEISAFPFPYLQDDECSHFLGLFQDMDSSPSGFGLEGFGNNDNNTNPKKRPRKDDEGGGGGGTELGAPVNGGSKAAFGDILATLLLLDEEAKQQQEQWDFESNKEKSLLEANHKKKVKTMDGYYNQMQDHYSAAGETDGARPKRARKTAVAAVVSAVASGVDTTGSAAPVPAADIASGSGSGPSHRRLWVKERTTDWWDRVSRPDFPEDEFRREFRMSKSTFNLICEELDTTVTKKNTMLRDAIPAPKRVGVCVWRLATGAPLRHVSERFGLGISTCHKLVIEVCRAIYDVLMPKYLLWPSDSEINSTKAKFESVHKIPNVVGSIYTTHIPIIAPKVHVAAYFNKRHTERNQKTSYSITVQGVVNADGIFTDVCIGNPGSLTDDQILEKSSLSRQRAARGMLRDSWIVGNSGFPLTDWLLVPYARQNLTWTQHAFNESIGEIQGIATAAFERLKGRWACLQKRTEVKLQDLPYVLGACCVLHNICEMRKEEMSPDLKFEVFDDVTVPENNIRSATAVNTRDHISHNLLHRGLAGTRTL